MCDHMRLHSPAGHCNRFEWDCQSGPTSHTYSTHTAPTSLLQNIYFNFNTFLYGFYMIIWSHKQDCLFNAGNYSVFFCKFIKEVFHKLDFINDFIENKCITLYKFSITYKINQKIYCTVLVSNEKQEGTRSGKNFYSIKPIFFFRMYMWLQSWSVHNSEIHGESEHQCSWTACVVWNYRGR